VNESNFKTLLVLSAHLSDTLLINTCSLIISEVAKEVHEGLADPPNNFLALDPLRHLSLYILVVDNISHHVLISITVSSKTIFIVILLLHYLNSLKSLHPGKLFIFTVLIFIQEGPWDSPSLSLESRLLVHFPFDLHSLLIAKLSMLTIIIDAFCLIPVEFRLSTIVTIQSSLLEY